MPEAQSPDVNWLLTLRAADRARFLALVSHELTVEGRMLGRRAVSMETDLGIERLRQLNEIQHQLTGYIYFALGPDEEVAFLPIVVRCVLEPRDEYLRKATSSAWQWALQATVRANANGPTSPDSGCRSPKEPVG